MRNSDQRITHCGQRGETMSQILKTDESTDATPFGGDGKCIIRVHRPNNGAWPADETVKLQWKSLFDNESDVWYDEGIEWTEPGPKTVYLSNDDNDQYRLHTTNPGFHAWVSNIVEPVDTHP